MSVGCPKSAMGVTVIMGVTVMKNAPPSVFLNELHRSPKGALKMF